MRVAHVLGSLRPSGMERMLLSSQMYMQQEGIEGIVIGQGSEHPFRADLENSGMEVHLIPPLTSIRGGLALIAALRMIRPDVVHIHTEGGYGLSAPIARMVAGKSVRIIRTIHSIFQPISTRARLSRFIQHRVADRFVDHLVAVSSGVMENEARFGRSCHVILNWVDDRYFEHDGGGACAGITPIVTLVGNCSHLKNHLPVISAVRDLPGVSLAHLGDETCAGHLEEGLLARLTDDGRVSARGVADPYEVLADTAIFCMPSRNEGMGIALAEALAMGLPCLIADIKGLAWAAGFEGVGVVAKDDGWTEAISSWIANLGASTRFERDTELLSARVGTARYVALYGGVRQGRGGRAERCTSV